MTGVLSIFNGPIAVAVQTTATQSPGAETGSLSGNIFGDPLVILVVIIFETLVWGTLLKFLIPAIAKKPLDWPSAFHTGLYISTINMVLWFVSDLIRFDGILSIVLWIVLTFLVATFTIHKTRDVPLPQSVIITLVGSAVKVTVPFFINKVFSATVAAAGAAS